MQNIPPQTFSAEQAGYLFGGVFWIVIIVWGIFKCLKIMKRPTTSRICVIALLCVLVAWLISGAGQLVEFALSSTGANWLLLKTIPMILCLVAAFIVAIVGLATYDSSRHLQGRAQAIWALVLSLLLVPFLIISVVFRLSQAIKARDDVADDLGPNQSAPGASGKVIAKPEYNFSIAPASKWVSVRPEALNKLACVAMRRSNPDIFFIVIAESLSGSLNLDTLTEMARANLAAGAEILEQKQESVVVNGHTFSHLMTHANAHSVNMKIHYDQWLCSEHGFTWQFMFWGPSTSRESLAAQSRAVIDTFKVLDPTKSGGGAGSLVDVSRQGQGYSTKLEGMGWNTFAPEKENNALMQFGAQRLSEALVVLPLRFDSLEPPDLDALTRGLLHTLEFEYTEDGDFESKPWSSHPTFEGREVTTKRLVEETEYEYILRVVRDRHSAWLLAGWAATGRGDLALVRRSLDAITLQTPSGENSALTTVQKTALGQVLNEAGLSYFYRKQYDKAATWFEEAFNTTSSDGAMLENVGNALEKQGKYKEGCEKLAPHIARFPKYFQASIRLARLQWLNGEHDTACTTFLETLSRGLSDEDELYGWLDLLATDEAYAEAAQCAEAWVKKRPSANSQRWLAQVTFLSGKQKEALSMLEELMEKYPKDRKIAYDLGGYYNDAGENEKAAVIAEKILKEEEKSPRALMILGWSQMGRKWYRDAKASFERAAKISPNDENVQDAIRQASAMLGQGDNSNIREPLELVSLPAGVAEALQKPVVATDFGKGHSSAWVMRATGWHFVKGKALRKTIHRKVKIVTDEGARDFSSVEIPFNPINEDIFMNRLEVKNADGVTEGKASIEDAYVRDYDDGTANHQKVLHIQVPGVKPGCTIEWEITIQDRFTSDTFSFERQLFANSLPVNAEAIFITGDVSQIKSAVAQGESLQVIRNEGVHAWIAHDLPPADDEPLSIWAERRCPMLWLGGEEGSWQTVAGNYLKDIADRLKPEESVVKLAGQLTQGLSTEGDKIAAIARHVQKDYAYKAIEFGVRARRPNSAAETVRQRYGDCKDFALLLHQLLQGAGIESHLALVQTNWRLQPGIPSLDQFNHMVVYVPSLGETWLIDATNKHLDLARYPSGGFWQEQILILDPAHPHLMTQPQSAPARSCEISSKRTLTMDGEDWKVEETLQLNGYYAAALRSSFTGMSEADQAQNAQKILAAQGAAQLETFHFEHLDDPSQDAVLKLTYRIRDAVRGTDAALSALWEKDYLASSFVRERHTAFEMFYPMHFTSDVTVKLPSAATKESLARLSQEGRSKFCEWRLVSTPARQGDASQVHVQFEFTCTTGEHPAEAYSAYHDSWEAARRAWDRQISWKAK